MACVGGDEGSSSHTGHSTLTPAPSHHTPTPSQHTPALQTLAPNKTSSSCSYCEFVDVVPLVVLTHEVLSHKSELTSGLQVLSTAAAFRERFFDGAGNCRLCPRSDVSWYSRTGHLRQHINVSTYCCSYCTFSSMSKGIIVTHEEKHRLPSFLNHLRYKEAIDALCKMMGEEESVLGDFVLSNPVTSNKPLEAMSQGSRALPVPPNQPKLKTVETTRVSSIAVPLPVKRARLKSFEPKKTKVKVLGKNVSCYFCAYKGDQLLTLTHEVLTHRDHILSLIYSNDLLGLSMKKYRYTDLQQSHPRSICLLCGCKVQQDDCFAHIRHHLTRSRYDCSYCTYSHDDSVLNHELLHASQPEDDRLQYLAAVQMVRGLAVTAGPVEHKPRHLGNDNDDDLSTDYSCEYEVGITQSYGERQHQPHTAVSHADVGAIDTQGASAIPVNPVTTDGDVPSGSGDDAAEQIYRSIERAVLLIPADDACDAAGDSGTSLPPASMEEEEEEGSSDVDAEFTCKYCEFEHDKELVVLTHEIVVHRALLVAELRNEVDRQQIRKKYRRRPCRRRGSHPFCKLCDAQLGAPVSRDFSHILKHIVKGKFQCGYCTYSSNKRYHITLHDRCHYLTDSVDERDKFKVALDIVTSSIHSASGGQLEPPPTTLNITDDIEVVCEENEDYHISLCEESHRGD